MRMIIVVRAIEFICSVVSRWHPLFHSSAPSSVGVAEFMAVLVTMWTVKMARMMRVHVMSPPHLMIHIKNEETT